MNALLPGLCSPVEESSDEWHTPDDVLDFARHVLGGPIDLDPCSHPAAQQRVQARLAVALPDDGLARDLWAGRVWLNPPYSNPRPWVERLLHFAAVESVSAFAVILHANAMLGTNYGLQLVKASAFLAFAGRVQFLRPDGAAGEAPRDASVIACGGADIQWPHANRSGWPVAALDVKPEPEPETKLWDCGYLAWTSAHAPAEGL